jgi:hypothetical protein
VDRRVELRPKAVKKGDVSCVAEWRPARERTRRELQPDDGQEAGQLDDANVPAKATFDTTHGRYRQAASPRYVGQRQAAIDARVSKLAHQVHNQALTSSGSPVDRAFSGRHAASVADDDQRRLSER